jgi:hypothetical protein
VPRKHFEGFSVELPARWSDLFDDASYSDPTTLPPVTFAADDGPGKLMVAPMLFDEPDELPGTAVGDVAALARQWGHRRRIEALEAAAEARPWGALGTARYRVRNTFAQVWYLSNGDRVVQAIYVCPWTDRTAEQAEREAIISSLRCA